MRLRLREFERAAGPLIRREVEASDELRERRRQAKRSPYRSPYLGLVFALFMAVAIGSWIARYRDGYGAGLLMFLVWTPLITLMAAGRWMEHEGEMAQEFWQWLPLTREELLRVQARRVRRNVPLLGAFIAAIYGFAYLFRHDAEFVAFATVALLQFAMILAAAAHYAAFVAGSRVAKWVGASAMGLAALGFTKFGQRWILESAEMLSALLPTGWALRVAFPQSWRDFLFLLPIAVFAGMVPASLARVRQRFITKKIADAEVDEHDEDERGPVQEFTAKRGVSEIAEAVARGELSQRAEPSGWIERFAWRWFTESERRAAAFVWAFGAGWTRHWIWAARALLVLLGVAWILRGWLGTGVEKFYFGMLAGLVVSLGAAPLMTAAPGVRAHRIGLGAAPFYAGFPLTYWQLFGVLFKGNLVRVGAWAPMFVAFAALLGTLAWGSAREGAIAGVKVVAVALILQPLIVMGWISATVTLTRQRWSLLFIPLLLGTIGVVGWFVFGVHSVTEGVLVAGTVELFVLLCLVLHRQCYRGSGMDLITRQI